MNPFSGNEKLVVLSCPRCGRVNSQPLDPKSCSELPYAKAAAYSVFTMDYKGAYPRVGKKKRVVLKYPFCCRVGDTFNIVYREDRFEGDDRYFATFRLLGILGEDESRVKAVVRLEGLTDCLSMNPETAHLADLPGELSDFSGIYKNTESLGGGDIITDRYYFVGEDKKSHLICVTYIDFERAYTLYGNYVENEK